MIKCPECNKEFRSERAYSGHKSVHREGGRYTVSRVKVPRNNCLNCEIPLVKPHQKYCSGKCQQDWVYKNKTVPKIETKSKNPDRSTFRYLVEKHERKCSVCNNYTWNDSKIPLDIDHINGDPTDNAIDNLRLICPNCHRQTNTWGMKRGRRELKNKGKDGRRSLEKLQSDHVDKHP